MKKFWIAPGCLLAVCLLRTAFGSDPVAPRPAPSPPVLSKEIIALRCQVDSLKTRLEAAQEKLAQLERTQKPPTVIHVPPGNGPFAQKRFVIPSPRHFTTPADDFADLNHPPKIWGEGECNGWKYYLIPLAAHARLAAQTPDPTLILESVAVP